MDLENLIDEAARAVIGVAPNDRESLARVRAAFMELERAGPLQDAPVPQSLLTSVRARLDEAAASEVDEDLCTTLRDAIEEIQGWVDEAGTAPPTSREESAHPPSPNDDSLIQAWIASALDTAGDIEAILLLEGEMEASSIAELRRLLHNLKGECGVVGISGAQSLFHEAESTIDRVTDAGETLVRDWLFELVDWTRDFAAGLQQGARGVSDTDDRLLSSMRSMPSCGDRPTDSERSSDGDSGSELVVTALAETDETVTEFLSEAREHLSESEGALLELDRTPDDLELVNTVFRAFHTIKGVAGFLDLEAIVRLSHTTEFALDQVRNGERSVDAPLLGAVLQSSDLLGRMFDALEGGTPVARDELDSVIRGLGLDATGDADAPPPAPDTAARGAIEAPLEPAPDESKPAPTPAPSVNTKKGPSTDHGIKVSTGRLDSIVDLVGELVIAQQMVVQDPSVVRLNDQRSQRNLAQVGKIIRDLQEVAMSLRMVTMRATFQKMNRLVRDLSSKSGKRIRLEIEGEDTELDRTVVDEIRDPLVHMIRNACDHGLESPEERLAAGKAEEGTLKLRAFHKGGSIVVAIEDDGRGLPREKILRKAIERGVIARDRDPNELSDDEVYALIFAPGFSTADQVSDVSGRGVGMDVVRRNVEALRGKVEISSVEGHGTTFHLSLPLTMAIIDGMVVRVGDQRYVIPTLAIEQSLRPAPNQLETVMNRGEAILLHGELLPVYRLSHLFRIDGANDSLSETLLVVLESNSTRCCLQVDELLGQQQVVIKSLGDALGQVRGVSGGAILGDGRVAPILDVAALLAQAEEPTGALR